MESKKFQYGTQLVRIAMLQLFLKYPVYYFKQSM